ncbi:MAG: hypothetical protein F4Y17_00785 [Gemmatimonadetes bacterium]|nr:hypothetical protein [Gemmatimonadota bacterium]
MIASRVFAEALTGRSDPAEAAESLTGYGSSVMVVTLGEEGSYTLAEGRSFHTPAFPVEVVDTTGAGDVFHGAYTFGLLQDWSLEKTAVFSSAVAALSCTRLGGRTGIPDLSRAMDFLREREAEHFDDGD